jgi:hypothetical protein
MQERTMFSQINHKITMTRTKLQVRVKLTTKIISETMGMQKLQVEPPAFKL